MSLPPHTPNGLTVLDLCCKQGGASMGYHLAGFNVVGVDREPQPRYPFPFIQADLRDLDPQWVAENFDAVTGSPPCWAHSDLAHRTGREYEDFIPETRALVEASGLPYVIENVEGAPLHNPLILCGTMFDGLRVSRHRLFESNLLLTVPRPCPKRHPLHYTLDKRKAHYGRLDPVDRLRHGHRRWQQLQGRSIRRHGRPRLDDQGRHEPSRPPGLHPLDRLAARRSPRQRHRRRGLADHHPHTTKPRGHRGARGEEEQWSQDLAPAGTTVSPSASRARS